MQLGWRLWGWAVLGPAMLAGCQASPPRPDFELNPRDTVQLVEIADVCSDCIQLREVARLGTTEGAGYLLGAPRYIAVTDRNEFVVPQGDELKVYSPEGDFVGSVGRAGQGPLEFGAINVIISDDRGFLHVFDQRSRRHTVLSSDFELVRTNNVPALLRGALAIPGDKLVLNMTGFTPDGLVPLHIARADDLTTELSFGVLPGEAPIDIPRLLRRVAWDPRGRLLSADPYENVVAVWSRDGSLIGTMRTDFPEQPSAALMSGFSREEPPRWRLMDLHVDGQGLLWLLAWLPRDDWAENLVVKTRSDGSRVLQPANGSSSLYRTVVEVIDLENGEIIARGGHDTPLNAFLPNGRVQGVQFTDEGAPQIAVYTIRLHQGDG